jgi:hypothetical protein
MGVDNFSYGSDLVGFVVAESTYGTAVKPAATDAFRATSITMGAPVGREFPNDRRNTRSRVERTITRTPVQPFSASGILRPSGSAGTAPDIGLFLKHALGTETVSGGSSVTYSLLKDPTALSASIYRKTSDLSEAVYGAVVQNLTFNWSGDSYATWTVSGVGKDYAQTGNTLANGAGSSATALVVDDADFFSPFSVISVGSTDNVQVTAVNYATNTLTIASSSWSDNDVVKPYTPSPTLAGDPLFGTAGTLSLDNGSTTITHLGGSLSINTGIDLLNTEYGSSSAADVTVPAYREVTGSLDFLVRKDEVNLFNEFRRNVQKDLLFTIGDTTGKRMKINCNVTELDPTQRDSPDADMIRYSVNFVALASSSGDDEVTLVFD